MLLILAAFAGPILAGAGQAAIESAIDSPAAEGVAGIDQNRDGAIDRSEWRLAGQRTFDMLDTDHDGAVSRAEFTLIHGATFYVLDRDRDGLVTPGEVEAYNQLPWTLGWKR